VPDRGAAAAAAVNAGLDDRSSAPTGTVTSAVATERVAVDRPSLEQLAETTRGHYYGRRRCPSLSRSTRTWARRSATRCAREVTQWYVGIALLLAFAVMV
jgi:Ca-activated chloride channel family protein